VLCCGCQEVGLDDIVDVDEIPSLRAVAVDGAGDEAADERVDAVRKTAARLVGKPDTVGRKYVIRRSQRRAPCGLPRTNGESSLRRPTTDVRVPPVVRTSDWRPGPTHFSPSVTSGGTWTAGN